MKGKKIEQIPKAVTKKVMCLINYRIKAWNLEIIQSMEMPLIYRH